MIQYLPLALSYLPAILCGIHVIRTGQNMYWLWLLLAFGPVAALIYVAAIVLPSTRINGRGLVQKIRLWVDPKYLYRMAQREVEETPTVHNRMKLAVAAEGIGHLEEAERLVRECAAGHYEDDEQVLEAHIRVLVGLKRYDEALARIQHMREVCVVTEKPRILLLWGQALEGTGQLEKACDIYHAAAARGHGFEALARRAALLLKLGQKEQAEKLVSDLDARRKKAFRGMRAEANEWFQFARRSLQKTA